MQTTADSPVKAIPPTEEIRQRLSETVRESKLLRSMLRLAEARDKAAGRRQPQVVAADEQTGGRLDA
jgi:hypothetical protein